jgi:hypothetical protein
MENKDFEVFEGDQREVLVKLQDGIAETVRETVNEMGVDTDLIKGSDSDKFYAKDQKKLASAASVWKNDGQVPGLRERVTLDDLIKIDSDHTQEMRDNFSTDHPLLIPRVIGEVVKEAIEPSVTLTPLLQRINYSHGTQLTFPAMGAIAAADIPEGGEYPERSLDFAGQVVATIGKSGVAVKMTEEMIRYSLYDVMSMHLRAAGRAMIRHKEQKVADLITTNAASSNTLFDNTSDDYINTTGRDSLGAYNGGLTLDDIFKAYATMINRGFTPNALIMNPFGWQVFANEGLQRLFGFQNGGDLWGKIQGAPGAAPQWKNGGMNGLLQNSTVSNPENLATTLVDVPGVFPYPFTIVVTPYMPYDSTTNTVDIVMCDLNELGVLVVDEDVVTEAFDDPARDIRKVKLRERYGLGTMNNGQGTGLIKGVFCGRTFDFGTNISTTVTATGLTNPLTGDYGGDSDGSDAIF